MGQKISNDQLSELIEVESMCFFLDFKTRQAFRKSVCDHVGCSKYKDMDEASFEDALEFGKEHLRSRGNDVFSSMIKRSSKYGTVSSRNHTMNAEWSEDDYDSDEFSGGFY